MELEGVTKVKPSKRYLIVFLSLDKHSLCMVILAIKYSNFGIHFGMFNTGSIKGNFILLGTKKCIPQHACTEDQDF